jgi:Family of unknown function (DUF5677)
MPDIPKMLSAAHTIKAQLDDEILLKINVQDSGEARVSATLCLSIAEQFAATLHLIEGGFSAHAPIIVRSMLEGLANLLNLVRDANYLNQINFDNARNDVILFTEYAAVPDMQDNKEALATLAAWKKRAEPIRDELSAKGFQKQDVIEKFKKADILQNYVAYRVLCSFSHNQLTTLIARHAGHNELLYHREAPPDMTASLLTVAVSIICRAIETVPKFTDVSRDKVRPILDAADAMWTEAAS